MSFWDWVDLHHYTDAAAFCLLASVIWFWALLAAKIFTD